MSSALSILFFFVFAILFFLLFAIGACFAWKRLRGNGTCCGCGAEPPPQDETAPQGPIAARKLLGIEGMHCMHCVQHLTKALNALDGVTAEVHLAEKSAVLSLAKPVADETLKQAVSEAGFEVTSIREL